MPEKLRDNHNSPEYWDKVYQREVDLNISREEEERYNNILSFINNRDKILDFGCGWGEFIRWCTPKKPFAKYTGIDYSQVAITTAKRIMPNHEWICDDKLPQHGEQVYDVVSAQHTLEHFEPEDRQKFLEQAYTILKPGGRLVIVLPLYDDWHEHPELWKIEDIRDMVREEWFKKHFKAMVVYRPETLWTKPDYEDEEAIIVGIKKEVMENAQNP